MKKFLIVLLCLFTCTLCACSSSKPLSQDAFLSLMTKNDYLITSGDYSTLHASIAEKGNIRFVLIEYPSDDIASIRKTFNESKKQLQNDSIGYTVESDSGLFCIYNSDSLDAIAYNNNFCLVCEIEDASSDEIKEARKILKSFDYGE